MFKIGDFSRLNKVSVNTLRYYDEFGILKPAKIEDQNGYRYYSADQIPKLNRILALKDLGFSLNDIASMLDNELTTKPLITTLSQKALEIKENIRTQTEILSRLQILINKISEEVNTKMINYDVIIKQVESIKVASLRSLIPSYDKQGDLWSELISHLNNSGVKIVAPCIAIYHASNSNKQDTSVDVEVAAYITSNIPETEKIKIKELETIKEMACVVFKGFDENSIYAYTTIQKWIEDHRYTIIGPGREVHLEGFWSNPNSDEHITEIQIPVAKQS